MAWSSEGALECPKSCFHLTAFAAAEERKNEKTPRRKLEFLASQIFLLFDANVPFYEITIPNTADSLSLSRQTLHKMVNEDSVRKPSCAHDTSKHASKQTSLIARGELHSSAQRLLRWACERAARGDWNRLHENVLMLLSILQGASCSCFDNPSLKVSFTHKTFLLCTTRANVW